MWRYLLELYWTLITHTKALGNWLNTFENRESDPPRPSLRVTFPKKLSYDFIKVLATFYHRFQFYATIGGFSSEENCVSAAVNHRYHIWKCMRRAGFASNGFQLSLACSLFIFGRILQYKILRRFFMLAVRFYKS